MHALRSMQLFPEVVNAWTRDFSPELAKNIWDAPDHGVEDSAPKPVRTPRRTRTWYHPFESPTACF